MYNTLRTFLGTIGYYRRHLKDFATIAGPLNQLLHKDTTFDWTADCDHAFKTLKPALLGAPILGYPLPSAHYIVDTDASYTATGAVLSQIQAGSERVI